MLRCRKSATAELRCVPPATGVPATGAAHVPGYLAQNLEGVEVVLTEGSGRRTRDAGRPASRSGGELERRRRIGARGVVAGMQLRSSWSSGSMRDLATKVHGG